YVQTGGGMIERNTDSDYFAFTAGPGAISLRVDPFSPGPNLDVLAELYNSNGQLIATGNPADHIYATIDTTLATGGTYYLRVAGAGTGDPLTTGYTNYASLGRYTFSLTAPAIAAPLSLQGSESADTFGLRLTSSGDLQVWQN